MSIWPSGRALHGGVDEIPLPAGGGGRLWLCGKHFVAPDPEAALAGIGADTVVCLNEQGELAGRYPGYVTWLQENQPDRALWWPIPDLHAPDIEDAASLIAELRRRLAAGHGVLLHCGAGIGRAGTIAAGLLIDVGMSVEDAVAHVGAHRPMAGPEAGVQAELLGALALGDG